MIRFYSEWWENDRPYFGFTLDRIERGLWRLRIYVVHRTVTIFVGKRALVESVFNGY